MTAAARTDIFRPSAPGFDPEEFACLGVFDTDPDAGQGRARAQVSTAAREAGFAFDGPYGPQLRCGHCGAYLRYVALMAHQPTQTLIYVGEQCLEGRFEQTAAAFATIRAEAEAQRKATRAANAANATKAAVLEFLAAHDEPLMVELSYRGNGGLADQDGFIDDIAYKLFRYGSMSDRQAAAVLKAMARRMEWNGRDDERARAEAARVADATPAPSGRVEIVGTVGRTWLRDTIYGTAVKFRVETAEGWVAIGTVPAKLLDAVDDSTDLVGRTVAFTATLTPSDDDATVAWANRPAKARIV